MFNLMTKDFNNFFDGFFNDIYEMKNPLTTDLSEKDGVYTLSANLAGFDKDDIKVELKNGYLNISAEKSEKEEGDEEHYYLKESYSKVNRSFFVGKDFTEEDFNAKFENGLLTLTFDKKEPKQLGTTIEIK